MNDPKYVALAKVLAAAAWADGRIEVDEVNRLKRFMVETGLDGEAVAEVSHLLETPITRSEAEAYTSDFLAKVSSASDKERLYDELYELFASDGDVSAEESAFLQAVKSSLETHTVVDMVLDRVRGLFSWSKSSPNERSALSDALRSRLQSRVRQRLDELTSQASHDAERLNRAALFGAILQTVARADGVVNDVERERLVSLIADRYGYGSEERELIESALSEQVTDDLDTRRLAAEFNRVSSGSEREQVLWAMFMVASADHNLSDEEVHEIRRIADFLWIDRRTFNDVRLEFTPESS